MSPAQPVPIVRRAPAAGLFGRKSEAPAAERAGVARFPWEQLLFPGDAVEAGPVIVPFPVTKS